VSNIELDSCRIASSVFYKTNCSL